MELVVCSPSFLGQLLLPVLIFLYRPVPILCAFDILPIGLGLCLCTQRLRQFLLSLKPGGIPGCDFGPCRLLNE